jgi:hypothetical protein
LESGVGLIDLRVNLGLMRLSPTTRSFLIGVAVGAATILVIGFCDLRTRSEIKP